MPNVLVGELAQEQLDQTVLDYAVIGYGELRRLTEARLGAGVDPCAHGRQCGASVITRVYLTRRIDYTYANARIIAGALQNAGSVTERSKLNPAPAVNVNVATTNSGGIDPQVVNADVNAIRTQIDQTTSSESQGASFRFEAWDARGMTFASEYQRPVVVGWDGLKTTVVLRGMGN